MKSLSAFLVSCIFALLCAGCVLNYEDVSKESEYEPIVNACYSLSTNMLISRVDMPLGYEMGSSIYMIKPLCIRSAGREMLTEDTLKPEATLDAKSIQRSINSVLLEGKKVQAVVEVNLYKKAVDVPIVIDLKYLQSTNYMRRVDY